MSTWRQWGTTFRPRLPRLANTNVQPSRSTMKISKILVWNSPEVGDEISKRAIRFRVAKAKDFPTTAVALVLSCSFWLSTFSISDFFFSLKLHSTFFFIINFYFKFFWYFYIFLKEKKTNKLNPKISAFSKVLSFIPR